MSVNKVKILNYYPDRDIKSYTMGSSESINGTVSLEVGTIQKIKKALFVFRNAADQVKYTATIAKANARKRVLDSKPTKV